MIEQRFLFENELKLQQSRKTALTRHLADKTLLQYTSLTVYKVRAMLFTSSNCVPFQLFGIIVFGSISSQGWSHDHSLGKEICVLNNSSATCHFATFVGVMAFIAALGFLVGEWYFEQMSSIKTRKHYVIGDMGFSALWAAFYAIAFLVMCIAWSKTPEKYAYASANVIGAIFFAFFSIFSWVSKKKIRAFLSVCAFRIPGEIPGPIWGPNWLQGSWGGGVKNGIYPKN